MKTCCKCGINKPVAEFSKDASKRGGMRNDCKACAKIYAAARYAANSENVKSAAAARYAANPEKIKASVAARNTANPEKKKAIDAIYRSKNKDRLKLVRASYRSANAESIASKKAEYHRLNRDKNIAKSAAWAKANPARAASAVAAWQKANPEACRIIRHNRRARKRANGGRLSSGLAEKLFKLQRGKCACGCGQPLGDDYHLDHRMPVALGGANEDWNIQLLRKTCNQQKSAKHPIDFMQSRGFLL